MDLVGEEADLSHVDQDTVVVVDVELIEPTTCTARLI